MTLISKQSPDAQLLSVKDAWYLTPNMNRGVFAERLKSGPPSVRRRYAVRKFDAKNRS